LATIAAETDALHHWPVRVYYEDTDSGGVVYHSNYLNFMERARTEWLRTLGFEQTDVKDVLNVMIVVHSLQIDFKKPAKFNDLLTVVSHLVKVGRSSFSFEQKIIRDHQLLVQAKVKLACVSTTTFKPIAIPKPILLKLESI